MFGSSQDGVLPLFLKMKARKGEIVNINIRVKI